MFEEILRTDPSEFTRDEAQSGVAEAAGALAVQRNADGDIVIRQHRPLAGHDPQIVVPREEAATLVEAIRREMQAATG
jgi:hypothetical protein